MGTELITESFNTWLVIPSFITIFTIFVVIINDRKRTVLSENSLILGLLFSLLLMNILEVLTFGNLYQEYEFLLRIYYCSTFITSSYVFCLSERLINSRYISRRLLYALVFIINITLITLTLMTNQIVAGAEKIVYTISRVKGDQYWIFQTYTLFCFITAPILIRNSIINAANPLDKKRNTVILFSFIPLILTVLLVLVLMQSGIKINFSIFLPISTFIFVIVYLFTENKNDLFRFLVNIPFSSERAAYKEINGRVIEYLSKTQTDEKLSLKEMMSEIERTFINNALEAKDGDHNLAAQLLSISLSTIYRNKEKTTTDVHSYQNSSGDK